MALPDDCRCLLMWRMTHSPNPSRGGVHKHAPRSRPPIVRMRRIHEILSDGKPANCSMLARELEVSAKTIQRDIDYMRDQQQLPIDYDSSTRSYIYTRPVKTLPAFSITEGDLLALFIARESLDSYRGSRFGEMLAQTFEKMTSRLSDSVVFHWETLASRVEFHQTGPSTENLDTYHKVADAVTREKRLRFAYQGLQDKIPRQWTVHPYQVRFIEGGWYVVGWDEGRQDWRVFALPRMSRVKVLPNTFERDRSFDPQSFWSGSLGVYREGTPQRVVLRFRDWAARIVSEREWHASQEIKNLREGQVELTLHVQITPDLLRWILSWADAVEIRSPKKLQQEVASIYSRMAERSSGERPSNARKPMNP